jgi:hypothetical protein
MRAWKSSALANLSLEYLWVLYPGQARYALDKRITVLPASEVPLWADQLISHHVQFRFRRSS